MIPTQRWPTAGRPDICRKVCPNRTKAMGFTLLELLVVFAIMALLAATIPLAVGKLRESSDYRQTARLLRSELYRARQLAMDSGQPAYFQLQLDTREFGVQGVSSHKLPEPLTLRATVAQQELSPGQSAGLMFLPDGGSTGGSFDLLRPTGGGTRLRVDWLYGRVEQLSVNE